MTFVLILFTAFLLPVFFLFDLTTRNLSNSSVNSQPQNERIYLNPAIALNMLLFSTHLAIKMPDYIWKAVKYFQIGNQSLAKELAFEPLAAANLHILDYGLSTECDPSRNRRATPSSG